MIGPLSGFLLASPNDEQIERRSLDGTTGLSSKVSLRFKESFSRYWEEYIFASDRQFVDDPASGNSRPPFHYSVYCARSGSKLIVMTEKKRLTEYLIEKVLNNSVFPNLKHVSFQIEKIITAFSDRESDYRITTLHGRISGQDRSLRTMILYGSEVTDSTVFKDSRRLFNFYICGVAERSPDDPFFGGDEGEIARLGNDGSLSVQSFNRQRASDLNKIVNVLITNKWVDDWVVPWVGESE